MTKSSTKTARNSVFRRIKYLVLLQAGEKLRTMKTSNKKKTAFSIFLAFLAAAAVTGGLYFLFNYMKTNYLFSFKDNMLTTVVFLTQIISVITCLGSMMTVLYASKENMILMAFPCKYNEIFISKIIVFTLEEIKKSCFFVLPFLLSYGLVAGGGMVYWALLVPTWLFMTVFPVLVCATLSIPCIYIKRFLQNHSILYASLIALMLVGVFILVIYLLSLVPTPVRLVAIYDKFLKGFELTLVKINKFALFYNFIGKAMFSQNLVLYVPLTFAVFLVALLLCFLVAMPFYFKAASSSSENSKMKKHKVHKPVFKSLFATFLRKEVKLMFRSSQNINSAVSIIFIFPILLYVLNFILAAIRTNTYGDYMTIAFNLMITLSLISTYNANCAQAISSEGLEFSVLKAAPSNTKIVTWAKVVVTMVVDLLAVGTMCAVLAVTKTLGLKDILLMVALMIMVSLGNIFWSFQLDITHPKVNDYAVKGDAVIDNPNVAKALVIGFLVSTVIGVLTLILLIDDYSYGWFRMMLVGGAFFLARLYLYASNLKVYFNEIQG